MACDRPCCSHTQTYNSLLCSTPGFGKHCCRIARGRAFLRILLQQPCFSGRFVPYATLINFSPRPTTGSSTGSAQKVLRDPRDTPALRIMVSLTLTAVPIFVIQLFLGKPRLLLAIAFYLSLCGPKFQRSVRMFSAKHLEAHRPHGYFSEKYDKVFGRYVEFFLGYLYGDLPELGRTVHVRLHHKENGGPDDNASTIGYDRTNPLHFFWYLSDNIWTTLGLAPYAYFRAKGDVKNQRRMLWGITRYLIYFAAVFIYDWRIGIVYVLGSSFLHELHHGNHLMGSARLL